MQESKKRRKKASIMQTSCVACGCCVSVCPREAIHVFQGIHAQIDQDLCVGCSKCKTACPASIIEMTEVEV